MYYTYGTHTVRLACDAPPADIARWWLVHGCVSVCVCVYMCGGHFHMLFTLFMPKLKQQVASSKQLLFYIDIPYIGFLYYNIILHYFTLLLPVRLAIYPILLSCQLSQAQCNTWQWSLATLLLSKSRFLTLQSPYLGAWNNPSHSTTLRVTRTYP